MSQCNPKTAPEDPRNEDHPCFSEQAHHYFARMHLAVAPGCNIQCNYCNRKYNCANESRPGVVVDRLTPEEAIKKLSLVAQEVKELSVIGIAGPGDALCSSQRSFETMNRIAEKFPDLKLCLSTNGLELPRFADQIAALGVDHVTVTINTLNPRTAQKIYAWVKWEGQKRNDLEAMAHFLARQQEGLRALVNLGVMVKVNSLMMPGINDQELPALSQKLKKMGAFLHNIMPLISQPEHGTVFGLQGQPEPTEEEMKTVREACGDMKQMTHCHQCRADAIGKLGEDRFGEFGKEKWVDLETPEDNGAKQRELWRKRVSFALGRTKKNQEPSFLIAACSESMGLVNQHFGHADKFYIFEVTGKQAVLKEIRRPQASYCTGDDTCGDKETLLQKTLELLCDTQALVCLKVGFPIYKKLEAAGILPVVDQSSKPLVEAVKAAAEQVLARAGLEQKPTLIQEVS
ncbi:MAG: nitrogenase cofactor biosynthesis protein NifB [Candidatus Lambdaproteobacteria bacterium RIFOXYD1_FULL_56_27]|uniref:FeMo cofactor biosynthesis protein NifB n=1 Tax=Candidatus Lambdaproteobacteria bacterium RIFOXYD2_FULL_56_26 TaxID=1817773 RepID=A0A1F6H209_9PROT|nr:MAG: nitrogenase cofactor biosynthesis protein NifB [Candidatus Lambdaproteobacteria bacterium RIFOXYC1_FULL_56_13]OGH04386.1 MAG: nitrogenase cofactor biosynthesis protein NifB [Candidatus Lambdaproteobacteria bacterium RIFOXYD2_FULL_56_26]OGH08168.1 MAG: nitrogenase cofactor biosynthesis protein NifB [Candidatus Lambdaproteobacteria bacterium RIFOXYD1_FULL_56_27]